LRGGGVFWKSKVGKSAKKKKNLKGRGRNDKIRQQKLEKRGGRQAVTGDHLSLEGPKKGEERATFFPRLPDSKKRKKEKKVSFFRAGDNWTVYGVPKETQEEYQGIHQKR